MNIVMTATPALEEFLAQYGVKGMRWGHRGAMAKSDSNRVTATSKKKSEGGDSNRVTATSKPGSGSARFTDKSGPKRPKKMTDEELRAAVSRMQLEKQYKQLVSENGTPNRVSKETREFVSGIAKTAVKTAVTGIAAKQLTSLLEAQLGIKAASTKKPVHKVMVGTK